MRRVRMLLIFFPGVCFPEKAKIRVKTLALCAEMLYNKTCILSQGNTVQGLCDVPQYPQAL